MEKFFKIKERGSSIKTEIIAGIVTFCAMAYILVVNANMFSNPIGNGENILHVSYGSIYIATAISAVISCFLIGFIGRVPLALACGMGLNALFVYSVCISTGFTYENALVTILTEGIIFLILSLTGGLKLIYKAIPPSIRYSISAGIGLFIALLGLQQAKIIIPDSVTGVALNSFSIAHTPLIKLLSIFVALISLFVISILAYKKVKGSILWGILIGVVTYYILGLFIPDFYSNIHISTLNPIVSLKEFFSQSFGVVFLRGFDFSDYIKTHGMINFVLTFISITITFCLVNIFDNIGSIYAILRQGNLLENGEIPNLNKIMTANSLSVMIGSMLGVSPTTTYVEATTGVVEGGRTGLTSIVVGILFFFALFLTPVAQLVPTCASSAALIFVGGLMMTNISKIDWNDIQISIPAFLTICMMPYTCNVANGIAFGLLSYAIISTFTGKFKEIKPTAWIIILLFATMLLFLN